MLRTYIVKEIQDKFDKGEFKDREGNIIFPNSLVSFEDEDTSETIRGTVGTGAYGRCEDGHEDKVTPVLEVVHVTMFPAPDSQMDELLYLVEPGKLLVIKGGIAKNE